MSRLESEPTFVISPERLADEVAPSSSGDQVGFPIMPENRKEALQKFDDEQTQANTDEVVSYRSASPRSLAPSSDQLAPHLYEQLANAKILMANGEHGLATRLLGVILEQNPYHAIALRLMGQAQYGLGHLPEAIKCFDILFDQEPDIKVAALLGGWLIELNELERAQEVFLAAVVHVQEDCPELFEVYKSLGNIAVRTGDFDGAEEYYNKAFTMNPDSDVLLVNYGTLEIQRGHLEKALRRFRQAVELNSSNDKAWVGLALIHRQYGDLELATGNLERALDINPNNETAIRLLVDWAFKDSRMNQVVSRLETYLDGEPSSDLQFLLGKILFFLGRNNEAKTIIQAALVHNPELPGAEEFLAVIEQSQKKGQDLE